MSENPKKTLFWSFFWRETHLLPYKVSLFNGATPGIFNGTFILWVWLSSKTHKNTANCFSADLNVQNKNLFWLFWYEWQYFCQKCPFHCCNTLRVQLSLYFVSFGIVGACGKIPKRLTAQLWTQESLSWCFFGPKRTFLPYKCLFGQLCCEFQLHRMDTLYFRNVLVQTLKTAKKPSPWRFSA